MVDYWGTDQVSIMDVGASMERIHSTMIINIQEVIDIQEDSKAA